MHSSWRFFAHVIKDVFANLWAAILLLFFRRSALRWMAPSPVSLLVLLLLSLAVTFIYDFINEGYPGQWSPEGVAVYTLPCFILLVFGQFLASKHGLWRFGSAPAVLWLAADIIFGLFQCFMVYAIQKNWLSPFLVDQVSYLYMLLSAWALVAVVIVFTRALAWQWWQRVVIVSVLISCFGFWIITFSSVRLWYALPEEEIEAPASRLSEENVVYAQPLLLERALSNVKKSSKEFNDWYFLGVAGAYYQDVFRTEVETARNLFDNRFKTSGRSLVLINNNESVLTQPIATRTSIKKSLQRFSEQMNIDKDVLVLFITSHGSEDHEIELNYVPLEIENITPNWLRKTLDESKIKNRVIILSACYSGGFIPSLQNSDTLIIAAADAKRASFGCSDDADLTYFGRAFIDQALRKEHGFFSAFDQARQNIFQRERSEGFETSNPQIWVGESMRQNLPEFEKTLFPQP